MRFPLLVFVPVRHGHDRGVSSECNAIIPFQAKTLKRVRSKSDALFSYQPPFNLLAFIVLWPLSYVLSPRKLHSANVFMIKLTVSVPDNFPFDPSNLTRSFNVQFNSGPRRLSPTLAEIGNSLSQFWSQLDFTKGDSLRGNLPEGAESQQVPSMIVSGTCHFWKPSWGQVQMVCMARSSM